MQVKAISIAVKSHLCAAFSWKENVREDKSEEKEGKSIDRNDSPFSWVCVSVCDTLRHLMSIFARAGYTCTLIIREHYLIQCMDACKHPHETCKSLMSPKNTSTVTVHAGGWETQNDITLRKHKALFGYSPSEKTVGGGPTSGICIPDTHNNRWERGHC